MGYVCPGARPSADGGDRGRGVVQVGHRPGEVGRVLGLIGNSGNSTTPHLHFRVTTTAEFFPTDSPPFTFQRFRVLGQVEPRIWDDNLGRQPTGVLPITPSPYEGLHRAQYPLDREVLDF
ncbi:hypothetical protein [Streptomyces sp. CBMA123]|uniref:hypothetical protein n=1 Tax=Streptomyces sp. CBMA123 TaxID=1896313 RepID=UPI001CB86607|nr:hypothetical protein [Streptomyces sp. CBMA123]MBD0691078.1 hypothetical protein [Streptomyces sp. CBMA123]